MELSQQSCCYVDLLFRNTGATLLVNIKEKRKKGGGGGVLLQVTENIVFCTVFDLFVG